MGFLSELFFPVTFSPRRSIGGFTATLTIEETGTDELVITDHPVQEGASITDHAYTKPALLSLRAQWGEDDARMPLDELYAKLLELQASRIPFDVITGRRMYKNMLVKALSMTNDQTTFGVLAVRFQLQQIITVQVETTAIPPRAKQKQPGRTGATEKAGQKSAVKTDVVQRESALQKIANSITEQEKTNLRRSVPEVWYGR